MEEEYIACYEATRQAIWLKIFITKFGIMESISRPLTMYCNNSVVVCFFRNNKITKQLKHFDTKFMFIREKI